MPRVLNTEASIWKSNKTLVWKTDSLDGIHRWDTIVSNIREMPERSQIVVLTEGGSHRWLASPAAKEVRFILVSLKAIPDDFDAHTLGNVICLEELSQMYPFLGPAWDGTVEDAIVCAAVLFRYTRLVSHMTDHPRLHQVKLKVNLRLLNSADKPDPLVLIQQYYVDKKPVRAKEIYKCLVKNLENPLIDKIILFMESASKLPPDPLHKLVKIPLATRITYANCIEAIQTHVGPGAIVAFANSDIYLDQDTWGAIWSVNMHDTFLALLRWEESTGTLFGPRSDSQDTWVIHSDSVLSRSWDLNALRIPFGKSGCDNAILVEFLKQKFTISNPAMSLRTFHVHQSEVRNYRDIDMVDRPMYMHVAPTAIHESKANLTWDWAGPLVRTSDVGLDRLIKATRAKAVPIFCSQMNRDPSFVWSAAGLNTYVPPLGQEHLIDLREAFVSPAGLVYSHSELYVGDTDAQKTAWSQNTMSHLTQVTEVDVMMAFPLEPTWLETDDAGLYTLHYLSRVIKQHREVPEACIWAKKTEPFLRAFKLFKWGDMSGRLIEYNNDMQIFAKRVVGRSAQSVRIMPADIEVLRSALVSRDDVIPERPVAVLQADLPADLQAVLESAGYNVRLIQPNANATVWHSILTGAERVLLRGHCPWIWMAPADCKVLELQEDRTPSDTLLHLCAASKQEWTLLQYPRSTPDGFRKIVIKEVEAWLSTVASESLRKPKIIVPPRSLKGFFGHSGDTFREMVDLWAEQGYVERVEDETATVCWLDGVGKTLLYDRDTWEWLSPDQTFEICLTGNADPDECPVNPVKPGKPGKPGKPVNPWIFWPRHPRLVEKHAQTLSPIEDRKQSIVFFGRVENTIQAKYRTTIDEWQSLCDVFSMPVGPKASYMLDPEEYLLALKGSKYGLCLRGYGAKCNREIELLAMGTVPIVTPGVDYTNYIEPLVDGVHLIYVSTAEEARQRIQAISDSPQGWTALSKAGHEWWKRNASVEGSWSRTLNAKCQIPCPRE